MIHLKASQVSTWAKQHSATTPDKPVKIGLDKKAQSVYPLPINL